MASWYYVDRTQNRQGPVEAIELVQAYSRGEVDDSSLAWRDGLAEWTPLGQFRAELGLGASTVRPPAPMSGPAAHTTATAYSSQPQVPAKKGNGCKIAAIVLAVAALVLVLIIGILAAISVPAYNQYVARSKVAAAVIEARAVQLHVEEFFANTDRCPRDAAELGLAPPTSEALASLAVGEANTGMCMIEIELKAVEGYREAAGQRIRLSRDIAGDWYCTSDSTNRELLPADCR